MEINRNWKKGLAVMVLVGAVMVGVGGCVISTPESVLQGKWLVTTDVASTLPNPTYVTFNSVGEITEIQFVSGSATYTYDASDGLRGNAVVNGSSLNITVTFGPNTITFNGTLNSEFTEAKGLTTTWADVGNIHIEYTSVPTTMTKQ